jgi:uncharacterized protein YPO0396
MATHPRLGSDELAAALKQLDAVEAEARRLREQITRAMREWRAGDRTVADDVGGRERSNVKR